MSSINFVGCSVRSWLGKGGSGGDDADGGSASYNQEKVYFIFKYVFH